MLFQRPIHPLPDLLQGSFGSSSSSSFSSSHFFLYENPRRRKENSFLSHQSLYPSNFPSMLCLLLHLSAHHLSYSVLPGASQRVIFSHHHMMQHSQSWPPSNQLLHHLKLYTRTAITVSHVPYILTTCHSLVGQCPDTIHPSCGQLTWLIYIHLCLQNVFISHLQLLKSLMFSYTSSCS